MDTYYDNKALPLWNTDQEGFVDETGICLRYYLDNNWHELDIAVTDCNKIWISDTVSSRKAPVSKEFFLDLMGKLYDMAEVK